MKSFSIIAISALLAAVAAFPVEKRDIVYQTIVQEIIETVEVITTIYVSPPTVSTSTLAAAPTSASASSSETPVSLVFPGLSTVAPSSTPLPSSSTPPPPPSSSSTPPPPPPSSTSTPAPAPPASTSPAAPSGGVPSFAASVLPGASVSDGCFAGSSCTGDITYYSPSAGVGACGGPVHQDTENVVAVSVKLMGSLSSGLQMNPICGKTVHITDPSTGKSATATVIDKCAGCAGNYDLDLSPSLFQQFYPESQGRKSGITWYFD